MMKCLSNVKASLLLLLPALVAAGEGSVEVTYDNFETLKKGKNAFVKFQVDWCPNCMRMKKAWDDLAAKYADSSTILIGDVDCESLDGEELCQEFGVEGYPTLLYFVDGDPVIKEYGGGRDLDSLVNLVETKLVKTIPTEEL